MRYANAVLKLEMKQSVCKILMWLQTIAVAIVFLYNYFYLLLLEWIL